MTVETDDDWRVRAPHHDGELVAVWNGRESRSWLLYRCSAGVAWSVRLEGVRRLCVSGFRAGNILLALRVCPAADAARVATEDQLTRLGYGVLAPMQGRFLVVLESSYGAEALADCDDVDILLGWPRRIEGSPPSGENARSGPSGSRAAYERMERFWSGVLRAPGWRVGWLTTRFADGTPMEDGNPIASAIHPEMGRAVRIIQHQAASPEITGWVAKAQTGEGDVDELVIDLQATAETVERAIAAIVVWREGHSAAETLGVFGRSHDGNSRSPS